MSKAWLHDNDVVIKACVYQLLDLLPLAWGTASPAILATSTFSLPSQLKRNRKGLGDTAAEKELTHFLKLADVIEPEPAEIALAATLEEEALRRALPLDSGESQMVAVVALREMPLLLTGDKRAISALHVLGKPDVDGRIACLEQLMATLVQQAGCPGVRVRVCSRPETDKTLTSCFSCASDSAEADGVLAGLASYVRDLRTSSGLVLLAGDDLSAVVP